MDNPIKELINHRVTHRFIVTECILIRNERVVAFGLSFCAPNDQYDRKKGNRIARGRAYKAYEKQVCISPIRRWNVPAEIPFKGVAIEAIPG